MLDSPPKLPLVTGFLKVTIYIYLNKLLPGVGNMKEPWCPITAASAVLGRRWHLVIVDRLMHGSMRFNELKGSIPSISSKVLAETLREMEKEGLISRSINTNHHVLITYTLTEKGKELSEVLKHLRTWGEKWMSSHNS
jgi:DNA-binding HxlR family transcriptional regulator